jgi:protein O-GlcNAc transferase
VTGRLARRRRTRKEGAIVSQSFPPAGFGRSKAEIFQHGVQCHRAGQVEQAEAAYRRVLAIDPQDADALHLLGLLADQLKQHAQAFDYIGRAIRLKGDRPHYHNNAALALRSLGRLAEAEEAGRTALRLKPDYPVAHATLGMILRTAGPLDGWRKRKCAIVRPSG